jgi:copper(I)-binding protein
VIVPSKILGLTAGLLIALILAPAALAAPRHRPALSITHAWSQATPPSAPTAAGYLTIANHGREPDWLVSVASPAASAAELHLMSMTGGVMRMRPVQGGLVIPARRAVTLDPNGYHLMFVGLKRPFKAGDHIALTLKFRRAGVVRAVLNVESPDAMPGMDMSSGRSRH